MAAKYRKVDPRIASDPRFLTLLSGRWDRAVQTAGLPSFYHPKYAREFQARATRRSFAKKSKRLLAVLISERGAVCIGCGKKKNLQPDHALPITWGGTNDLFNLQLLCALCNATKGNQLPEITNA